MGSHRMLREDHMASACEATTKSDTDHSCEALFYLGVQRPEHSVEFIAVDPINRNFTTQKDRILDSNRKVGSDETIVPTKNVFVQLNMVLLRCRHYVCLVTQGALTEGEPHRREILVFPPHPNEPAHVIIGRSIDGDDVIVVGVKFGEPFVDLSFEDGEFLAGEGVGHDTTSGAG